jgi:23S rRNA-/tRNA-specific pseudouridylate synthase
MNRNIAGASYQQAHDVVNMKFSGRDGIDAVQRVNAGGARQPVSARVDTGTSRSRKTTFGALRRVVMRDATDRLPRRSDLRLIYDDGRVIAVDKPAGLPSTGRDRDDPGSLEHRLAIQVGGQVWAVHQLDADTSGVIVFVTRKSLVARWAERLSSRCADKRYLAVCHGTPHFTEIEVAAAIAATGRRTPPFWRVVTDGSAERARAATSRLKVLDRTPAHALIEVTLVTGRSHQARLHLAHVGHPLVGERVYRTPPCSEHPRQALHAHAIRFRDGGTPAELVAPLAADLQALCRRLGLRVAADGGGSAR